MKTTFAKRLKQILILAVMLNLFIIVMHIYSTNKAIDRARTSLYLVGQTALSSFEGGRRAMMLLSPENSQRFINIVNRIGEDTGVLSMYLFDIEGNTLLNSREIAPPKFDPLKSPEGKIVTPEGIFMYKVLPQYMMSSPRQGMGRPPLIDGDHTLVGGVMLDTGLLTSVKRSEFTFLTFFVFLEILLIAVYIYTARMLKAYSEQSKKLEASEREAEMGKMSQVMAHEIKNPLSTVKGLMEFSAKKADGDLKDISERCVDELSRLDRIVNDFLAYGKDITLNISETDIAEVTENTAKLLRIDADAKDINFNISGSSSSVKADSEKMKQVLFNLMLNAVQGAPEGSDINIEMNRNYFRISNKIANPHFEKENIGKPFYTTKTVGTGLGLAIVKRIAQLHGFKVNITANEIFCVQINFL